MISTFWNPGEKYGKWIISFAGFMCMFTTGQNQAWLMTALIKIINEEAGFNWTDDEMDFVVLMQSIGFFFGPFLALLTIDTIGRKNSLLLWSTLCVTSTIGTIFITDSLWLGILRFLSSTWNSISYTIAPLLLAEFLSSDQRDQIFSYLTVSWMAGALVQSLSGFGDYLTVSIVAAAPSLLLVLSLSITPETHYYYLMKNEKAKAKKTLIWLKGSCDDQELDNLEKIIKHELTQKKTFIDFFTNKQAMHALCISVIMATLSKLVGGMLFAGYFFKFFPTTLLANEINFLFYSISVFGGAFFPKLLLHRIGGVATFRWALSLGCGSLVAFAVWFYLRDETNVSVEGTEWILYVGLVVIGVSISSTITVQSKYQGELFSVNFKAIGSSLTSIISALGGVTIIKIYTPMTSLFGLYSNFVLALAFSLPGVVYTFWIIETKGRTLEEIQDDLKENNEVKNSGETTNQ